MDDLPERIAIFRVGHLGDTVIAMPAFWTIRENYPRARITLLTQINRPGELAQSTDVLTPGIVYDEVLPYSLQGNPFKTLSELRKRRIELLAYLPPARSLGQVRRDRLFFKLAGVKKVVGMSSYPRLDRNPRGTPLPTVTRESDALMSSLAEEGIRPAKGAPRTDIGLGPQERSEAQNWRSRAGIPADNRLIAVGVGSKMPSKIWSLDRMNALLKSLDRESNLTFLFFGAPIEKEDCSSAMAGLRSAINLAGETTVRESAAMIELCDFYVGNDTGTMHLAASAGVPCVALFSARDWPGRWYPIGENHRVHRVPVACEGCMLEVCDKDNLCMNSIQVEDVAESVRAVLRAKASL